jgi:muconolactone delta-isomerase
MMREFLVNARISTPDALTRDEVGELRRQERDVAELLAARGHLVRLWRVPGEWANWGLWRAHDEAELHTLLDALPLRPYMRVEVHPTEPHPSDPPSTIGGAH